MNLVEIILGYVRFPGNLTARESYLKHLVDACGVDPLLIPHIRGLEKVVQATYADTLCLENEGTVTLYLLKVFDQ